MSLSEGVVVSLPKTRRILNFHINPINYKVWYDQDLRAQLGNFP